MDYLPVFLSLTDRDCLVVGGGAVARRKVELLLRAGARVAVVAPKIEPALAEQARQGSIRHIGAVFDPGLLSSLPQAGHGGFALVVSATEKKEVNRQVAAAAKLQGVPVNVVDDPELCSFIFPAMVDRSPVIVAVSSGGKAPVLARLLKARLESLLPPAYGRLAELAGAYREQVKTLLKTPHARRKFWERSFQGQVGRLFLSGREREARQALEEALRTEGAAGTPRPGGAAGSSRLHPEGSPALQPGLVVFFAVDPQEPELLTLNALRHLQEADVIVHDPRVPRETLDMARRGAKRIEAGAPPNGPATPQDIPPLLARLAQPGRHVVRITCAPAHADAECEQTRALAGLGTDCKVLAGVSAKGA